MRSFLRQRNFALLWLGGLVSMLGDWMLQVALPFYIYQRTGSVLATATMVMASLLPFVLFGSVAGVFVDRWDRGRTIVVANLAQAAVVMTLLLVSTDGWLWLVYVVAFVESSIARFASPAESALLPQLVGEEQLVAANSLNALNDNLARMAGPPIGGALMAVFGLSSIILIDGLTFLVAAVLVARISKPAPPAVASDGRGEAAGAAVHGSWTAFWRDWMAGLQLILHQRVVAIVFAVVAVAIFGDNILTALTVPFIEQVLQGTSLDFGYFLAARGIGGIIGGLIVGQWSRALTPARLLVLSLIAVGGILVLMLNAASLPVAIALFGLQGIPFVAFMASHQSILQRTVPEHYLGRVYGTFGMTVALLGLAGLAVGGTLGELWGIVPVLNISGGLFVMAGLLALWLPATSTHEIVREAEQNRPLSSRS